MPQPVMPLSVTIKGFLEPRALMRAGISLCAPTPIRVTRGMKKPKTCSMTAMVNSFVKIRCGCKNGSDTQRCLTAKSGSPKIVGVPQCIQQKAFQKIYRWNYLAISQALCRSVAKGHSHCDCNEGKRHDAMGSCHLLIQWRPIVMQLPTRQTGMRYFRAVLRRETVMGWAMRPVHEERGAVRNRAAVEEL